MTLVESSIFERRVGTLARMGCVALILLLVGCSRPPQPIDIVTRAIEVHGGLDRYRGLRVVERISLYRSSSGSMGASTGRSESLVGEAFDVVGGRFFIERASETASTSQYFDFSSGTGWSSSSGGVTDLSVQSSPNEVAQIQVQFVEGSGLEVFSLMRAAESAVGNDGAGIGPLVYSGLETSEDRSVHVLSSTRVESAGSPQSASLETRYLFDEKSGFLLAKQKILSRTGTAAIRSEITYRGYEPVDDSVYLPRLIEMRQQGILISEIVVQQVALRAGLKPAQFEKPSVAPK